VSDSSVVKPSGICWCATALNLPISPCGEGEAILLRGISFQVSVFGRCVIAL